MSAQLERFGRFCSLLTIGDGTPFVLEDWQREVVADLLATDEGAKFPANGRVSIARQPLHISDYDGLAG